MIRDEKLEMKVGLFIGMGVFIMFLIVFSISDFYLLKKGYEINVIFSYANGLTENAPVRVAGVDAGEVKSIEIFYDEEAEKTRVKVGAWINGELNIQTDAVARINALGLLGEQYLEITPGVVKTFVAPGETIIGRTPVNIGEQMEGMNEFIQSFGKVIKRVEKGEGTVGKLLTDDALYNDLETILAGIKNGKGTVGKLLTKEKIYNDLESFVSDIKAHPWKLLSKPSRRKKKTEKKAKGTPIKV
ncbi:MAG: MCE family protein [Candidatus Omnitrophica bacterium]|nr:MCE family protein [Candidatus Omnitrophota bacterium]